MFFIFDLGGGYTDVCFIILLNCPDMFYAVFCMWVKIHKKVFIKANSRKFYSEKQQFLAPLVPIFNSCSTDEVTLVVSNGIDLHISKGNTFMSIFNLKNYALHFHFPL